MTTEQKILFYEGMDWKELRESDIIANLAEKVAIVMGPILYKDCLMLGIRPQEAFAEEYLSNYMHRIEIIDEWEGKQEFLSPMGSNPLSDFTLNGSKPSMKKELRYALSKDGEHLEFRRYCLLNDEEKTQYEIKTKVFSRTEIVTILRLNLFFRSLSAKDQTKWLDAQIEEYEHLSGENIE